MKKISGELRKAIGEAVAKDERTQKQISKDAGVKHSHLYQILNGTKQKVTPIAEALCETLGINPDDYNGGRTRKKTRKTNKHTLSVNQDKILDDYIDYKAKIKVVDILSAMLKKLEAEIGKG